jgi:2-polyprenyl-6-methoxyphenol hydroxylase-like FAD-dependent oxidoreductase
MNTMDVDVCAVGGGPAGMVLGLLLARAGVRVAVLEKHADFLRDFRGDTVHPSTLDVLDEIGLGTAAQALPHRKVQTLDATFADGTYRIADLSRLRIAHPYLAFVPQWDLLEMLAEAAQAYPTFTLLRSTEVTDLLRGADGRVTGVRTADGVEVDARLTVATDGRHSTVRERLALPVREFGAPMDVLWFRVSRRAEDETGLELRVGAGRLMIGIDRGDYWQIAYVIPKGGYDTVRAGGLPEFRAGVAALAPDLRDRVDEIADWDSVKVLTVALNRLRRWHAPGVLLIGDAAHAMSPVGGVGINLAVQDAVATARILGPKLLDGTLVDADLDRVRRRRRFPTAGTQLAQRVIQRNLVGRALGSDEPVRAPLAIRVAGRVPAIQARVARTVGVGLRPEHVGPAVAPAAS